MWKELGMICYLDKTWCAQWELCSHGKECSRALTVEHKKAAKAANLSICSYSGNPDCFEPKKEKK